MKSIKTALIAVAVSAASDPGIDIGGFIGSAGGENQGHGEGKENVFHGVVTCFTG